MNILYVGNTPENYTKCARENNVAITSVSNALEALKILGNRNDIKVVISNYNLPGNNGVFLYDQIKKSFKKCMLPFILVSKEYKRQLFKVAFERGINDYFVSNSTQAEQIIKKAKSLYFRNTDILDVNEVITPSVDFKTPLSKRIFDICFSLFALLLVSPILLLVMLLIRFESKGKVYYTARRVGRKPFDFYKLRSMKTGSDKLLSKLAKEKNQYAPVTEKLDFIKENDCPRCAELLEDEFCSQVLHKDFGKICDYWYNQKKEQVQKTNSTFIKIVNDPRVTKVGKFIRNTSIDELPQLINVLKGDMSIVGNRPLPIYEAELLTKDELSKRFLAPAGITGLWQVELRGKGGNMSEEERIELDNRYADYFIHNNYSFWYDIKLILKTIPALFQESAV